MENAHPPTLGDKRLDAIGATVVRALMATVAKRSIQARGPVNLLRTLLTAAVDAIRGKLPAARVVLNQSGRTPSRQAVWTEPQLFSFVTSSPSGDTTRSGITS